MRYKTIVCVTLFSFLGLLFNRAFADQPDITNVIFFGDSLSDIGNNTWIMMDGVIGTPITNPNEQNRKYLWVNYLVEKKLNKFVFPSSQQNLAPDNDSISYAYASADTGNYYLNSDWPQQEPLAPSVNPACMQAGVIKDSAGNITSTCTPGLLKQVDAYLNEVQFKPNPKTVFFIWSGANDLLNYYTAYMNHPFKEKLLVERFALPSSDELNLVGKKAVTNINAAKKKLMDAGVKAEMIYILDLPDLSKTPSLQSNKSLALKIFYGKQNVENSLRTMSQDFNINLEIQDDERYLLPASHYVQIEKLFNEILKNPGEYNLKNISESCIAEQQTPECKGFLFYNNKHPTTYTNKLIADNILKILQGE